jgi:hypothetical protein
VSDRHGEYDIVAAYRDLRQDGIYLRICVGLSVHHNIGPAIKVLCIAGTVSVPVPGLGPVRALLYEQLNKVGELGNGNWCTVRAKDVCRVGDTFQSRDRV